MNITRLKRTEIEELDYYPFFIDYNFKDARPRGGSAFIDFFAGGKLCALMDGIDKEGLVYMKKDNIAPSGGFFLMDFAMMKVNPTSFLKAVFDLNLEQLYIEDSRRYPLDAVLHRLQKVGIVLVSFLP